MVKKQKLETEYRPMSVPGPGNTACQQVTIFLLPLSSDHIDY